MKASLQCSTLLPRFTSACNIRVAHCEPGRGSPWVYLRLLPRLRKFLTSVALSPSYKAARLLRWGPPHFISLGIYSHY